MTKNPCTSRCNSVNPSADIARENGDSIRWKLACKLAPLAEAVAITCEELDIDTLDLHAHIDVEGMSAADAYIEVFADIYNYLVHGGDNEQQIRD